MPFPDDDAITVGAGDDRPWRLGAEVQQVGKIAGAGLQVREELEGQQVLQLGLAVVPV